jgi:hypothetical protein
MIFEREASIQAFNCCSEENPSIEDTKESTTARFVGGVVDKLPVVVVAELVVDVASDWTDARVMALLLQLSEDCDSDPLCADLLCWRVRLPVAAAISRAWNVSSQGSVEDCDDLPCLLLSVELQFTINLDPEGADDDKNVLAADDSDDAGDSRIDRVFVRGKAAAS